MIQTRNYCNNTRNDPNVGLITDITGNIVPHFWYSKITSASGKPCHNAIPILSEIIYWYRPNKMGEKKFKGDAWQTSYAYFEKKFFYNKEKIRRALVRLEELGLIARELRTIEVRGQKYSNVLFIHLLCDVNSLAKKQDIIEGEEAIASVKKISPPLLKSNTPSPQICGEHIDKENKQENIKSRSENESEFSKISSKNSNVKLEYDSGYSQNKNSGLLAKKGEGDLMNKLPKDPLLVESLSENVSSSSGVLVSKSKSLKEFIPLSEALYARIKEKTYKNYKVEFVNQLLEKLAEKYNSHEFYTENAFVNYIAKALDNEIIEEKIANLESFTFDKNYLEQQRKNKFIHDIESSINQDPASQVKRKIASLFDTEDAYLLLKNYKFPDKIKENKYLIESITEEGRNHILTQYQKERLFQEISNIFNIDPASIEIISSNKSVKYITNRVGTESKRQLQPQPQIQLDDSTWGKICKKLIVYYGEAVYISWFSKLTLQKNNNESIALILAPTRFMSDWIQNNYYKALKDTIQEVAPEIDTIEMGLQVA